MNLPCETVQDILPLYQDGICSASSRTLVEEHVAGCPGCRDMLNALKEDITPEEKQKEVRPLLSIRVVWNKEKRKAFFKGLALAVLGCLLLLALFLGLTQWKCIEASADDLTISEVSRLADGRITYLMETEYDAYYRYFRFETTEDGKMYIIPARSIIELGTAEFPNDLHKYRLVDIAEDNAWQQRWGSGIEITACYIGKPENAILIWEEGMELPAADEDVELWFIWESTMYEPPADEAVPEEMTVENEVPAPEND